MMSVELSVSSHKDDPRDRKSGNWSLEPGSWNLGGAKLASGVEGHRCTRRPSTQTRFTRHTTDSSIDKSPLGCPVLGKLCCNRFWLVFWYDFGPHWHPHGSLLMAFGRLWHHFCPKWLLVWFPCGTVFVPSGALLVSLAPLSGTSWWQATAKATKNVDM